MFQQITIIGNLGRDPEMRYTTSGIAVTSFSVATTKKVNGEDKTVWFRVSAWKNTAENCHKFLSKGSRVLVIGEVEEPKIFNDKEGNPRTSLEVTAHQVKFLSAREGAEPIAQTTKQPVAQNDDEIPF